MKMQLELTNGTKLVQKIVGVEIAPQQQDGQITAIISTSSVDSDGDIIQQGKSNNGAGWILDRFNKHPLMLWMHDHYRPSMGKAEAYLGETESGIALFARANFDQEDEFARQIESKIRRGVISETSVGFVASKFAPIDSDNGFTGYNFHEQELIEFSWVNRGANPDTESFIKSACLDCPDLGNLIEVHEDQELKEMRKEFIARIAAVEEKLKTVLDDMQGQVINAETHRPSDDNRWDAVTDLARQIAKTQAAFRGGRS